MDNNEFKQIIRKKDFSNSDDYDSFVAELKHNICQNMRIARKLSKIRPDVAAQFLHLEPQSLRRIEAENDRDEFSTKVFLMAIMLYKPDANFYFKNWKENERLLKK